LDEIYIAEGNPIESHVEWKTHIDRSNFQMHYWIVLMTYTISDSGSLQYLEEIYDKIPRPPKPPGFGGHNNNWRPEIRGLKMEHELTWNVEYPAYVALERYPVVIAGCKDTGHLSQQVEKPDIEKFISSRPNCVFGGEFSLDNLEEIDAVFKVVVGVIHGLRKKAVRDQPVQVDIKDIQTRNPIRAIKSTISRILHRIKAFK
jgi:hypothetical protein